MKTFNEWATDREDPDETNLVGEQASMMMQRFIGLLHGLSQKQKNEIVRKAISELSSYNEGDEGIPDNDADLDAQDAAPSGPSSPYDNIKQSSQLASRQNKTNQVLASNDNLVFKRKMKYLVDAFLAVPWKNYQEMVRAIRILYTVAKSNNKR
jgi:hypothetical protein